MSVSAGDISVWRMTTKLAISKHRRRVDDLTTERPCTAPTCAAAETKHRCVLGSTIGQRDDVYKRHYGGELGAGDVGCWPYWPPVSGQTDRLGAGGRRIGGALSRWSEEPSIRFNPRDHQSCNCGLTGHTHTHTQTETDRQTDRRTEIQACRDRPFDNGVPY